MAFSHDPFYVVDDAGFAACKVDLIITPLVRADMSLTADNMKACDAAQLKADLVEHRLLDSVRAQALYEEFHSELSGSTDGEAFAEFIIERGLLTPFQASRALNGDLAQIQYGTYTLIEPISGSSTLGMVYRAICRTDRQRYTLRVLPLRSLLKVHESKSRLRAFQSLPFHSTLIPFTDIDSANGSHYLAWPLVDGETLEHSVKRVGPLSNPEAVRLLCEVLDGLGVCHSAGLAHGFIQPSSILIGTDRKARLLDLGLGTLLSENMSDGHSMLDTVSMASSSASALDYSAPETITDPSQRTAASDIYSFGCTLYFALTGLPPFPDPSAVNKIVGHQTKEPVPVRTRVPQVPVRLANLIDRLMQKQPTSRLVDVATIRAELRRSVALPNQLDPDSSSAVPSSELLNESKTASSPSINFVIPKRPDESVGGGGIVSFDMDELPMEVLAEREAKPSQLKKPSAIIEAVDLKPGARPTITDDTPNNPNAAIVRTIELPATFRPPSSEKRSTTVHVFKSNTESKISAVPAPVNLGTSSKQDLNAELVRPAVKVLPPPIFNHKVMQTARSLLFWKPKSDAVQLSIFGPPEITPGQRVEFIVYAHLPEAFEGVSTLCRALRSTADLLGTGYIESPVQRGSELGLHLALENAGVARSLVTVNWMGQTLPRTFEVFVPWESPYGLAAGVLSLGQENQRVGTIPLHFIVLQRSG